MLLECGADVDATNNSGVTPLLLAARGPLYGNSVHAPLTLITAFLRFARSSTFGRSAQGSLGAGGVRGCMMPRWSMTNRASGWRYR